MRTFCIVCPEIEGEEEIARKHFDERGVPAEFIQGIYGDVSGLVTTLPYEFDHPGTNFIYGPRTVSLCLSHLLVWTACSVLPDDYFLILESDANFPEDWKERVSQVLGDAPAGWDMIYIGSCNCTGKPREHIAGDLYRMTAENPHHAPHCTHAILISKKALPVLIRTQRKFYCPIDLALIFESLPHLNFYVVLPRIVDQFKTDISD